MTKTTTRFAIKSNLLSQVAVVPLGLLNSILINRALGVELKGQFYFITLLVTFVSPMLLAGVNGSIHFYLANRSYSKSEIFSKGLAFNLIICVLAFFGMLLLHRFDFLGEVGEAMTDQLLVLGLIGVLPYLLFTFFSSILQSEMHYHFLNVINITTLSINVLLNAIAILVFKASIFEMVFIYVVVNALKAIWSGAKVWTRVHWSDMIPVMPRDVHTYGFKLWLNGVLSTTNQRIDSFLVGVMLNSTSLGIYSVGYNLTNYFTMIPNTFINVLFTRMSKETRDDKRKSIEALQHRILVLYCILTGVLNWFFIEDIIVLLYGVEFIESATVAKYLFFGISAYLLSRPLMKYNSSVGKPLLNTYGQGLGALVSVIMFLVLIPTYSYIGAMVATVIGYLVTYSMVLIIARRRLSIKDYYMFSFSDTKFLINSLISKK